MGTQTQALARPMKPIDTLRDMLSRSKEQIALALPKHITADRMMRVAITAVQKQPKLLECSPLSIIGSIIEASQLGLEPDGILGQAYLVPFWNGKTKQMEAQLQPGYRGLIALARRSGEVSTLYSELVYTADICKVVKGDSPKLVHEPNYDVEDRGELRGAYAVVLYKDGGKDFEYMAMHELSKIRASSKAKNREGEEYGPWATHPEEMYRKCPIRRLAKRLPLSPEFQKAAILDEFVDVGVAPSAIENLDPHSEIMRQATEHKSQELVAKYAKPVEEQVNPHQALPENAETAAQERPQRKSGRGSRTSPNQETEQEAMPSFDTMNESGDGHE